jgi:hypothetical protein
VTTSARRAPLLSFTAAGYSFGVFVVEIARILVEDAIAPVPFAHPAMAGLLLVEDARALVPVFDIAGLVDPSRPLRRRTGGTVALFPTDQGPVGLRLETVGGTIESYAPVSSEGAALFLSVLPDEVRRVVGGVALHDGAPLFFFSPEALLVELGLLRGGPSADARARGLS